MTHQKQKILELLNSGEKYSQIQEKVACSKGTISYHAKRIGKSVRTLTKYDWSAIQKYYDEGHTLRECANHFGFNASAWSVAVKSGKIKARDIESLDSLIQRKCKRCTIRRRIIKDNSIPYTCAMCALSTEWNNKPLSLHLDHINGINDDHRLENLRFLCPNCHSQTDTYGGRNTKK